MKPLVLIVEDDRTTRMMLENRLMLQGYEVIVAENGVTAKDAIESNHEKIDTILLDRMMPDIDGLEIVRWINNHQKISKPPIIMQTGADAPDQIKEGIDLGVFYYLTKPVQEEVLKSVVSLAVKESKQRKLLTDEISRHRTSFKLIRNISFKIRTLEEADDLACFLAYCFPDSQRVLPGIAAILINAVEHGICDISYEEKTQLISSGMWRQEVVKRLEIEGNKQKFVDVFFNKEGERHTLKIADHGKGFAWKKFLQVDPSRALHSHGRGVARASMLFDLVEYNTQGNEVVAVIDGTQQEDFNW